MIVQSLSFLAAKAGSRSRLGQGKATHPEICLVQSLYSNKILLLLFIDRFTSLRKRAFRL